MNPEDLDIEQPPEGILDPQQPYWPANKVGEITWLRLKGKLTGRRVEGLSENFTSYVKLGDADADRLIENIKKYGQYPQVNQNDKYGGAYNNEEYQKWLVEEFLEKPFRKEVDDKIEAKQIQSRIAEIVKGRKSANVQPAEPLLAPMEPIADPWEGSYTNSSDIKLAQQQEEETKIKEIVDAETSEDSPKSLTETLASPPEEEVISNSTESKSPLQLIPKKFPNTARQKITELSAILDNISSELSAQTTLVKRRTSVIKSSNEGLKLAQFLVGQQVENYTEFLNDLESQSREQSIDLGLDDVQVDKEPIQQESPPEVPEPKQEPEPPKQWWEFWKPDTKPQSPRKASSGLMSTSMPAMAEGGISPGTGLKNIIQPGIYTNPTVGNLAPGTAIIPLNRNYGKDMFGNYDEIEYMEALGEVMSLPMKGLLGSVISVYGSVLSSLGPLAGYFNSALPKLVQTAASILGIPVNAVLDMLGGPAYAGVIPNDGEERRFYRSWKLYMENNRLIFEGGVREGGDGGPTGTAEFAKDIAKISSASDLRYVGGTNVGKLPAWIPFTQSDAKQVGYVSGFGMRRGRQHSGIDLDGDRGIKIIAPIAGKVFDINRGAVEGDRRAGGGYGNLVGIEHTSPKIFTFYGHMKDVASHLQIGSQVRAGEVIGTIGNTGYSFGPHLHWEVRKSANGDRIDPVEWTHQNKPSFASGGNAWWDPMGVFKKKNKERELGAQAKLNGKDVYWAGKNYGWQQLNKSGKSYTMNALNAPGVQNRFIQDRRPTSSSKPQSKKPQANTIEKTTTTVVDPNLTPMQQWAKLYPELAKKVKPGQSGYAEIQTVLQQKPPVTPSASPTSTVTATQNKPTAKVTTIEMPMSKSNAIVSTAYSDSTPMFVELKMDTNMVMELQKLRRVQ